MTIYEIDQRIDELLNGGVNEETGELLIDVEEVEALQMERDAKVENLACAVKNFASDIAALREEEKALASRRHVIEAKAERARDYLAFVLGGEKFASPKAAVSYRVTKVAEIDDSFIHWAKAFAPSYLRIKEPEPDKIAIVKALKSGVKLQGATLADSVAMIIK